MSSDSFVFYYQGSYLYENIFSLWPNERFGYYFNKFRNLYSISKTSIAFKVGAIILSDDDFPSKVSLNSSGEFLADFKTGQDGQRLVIIDIFLIPARKRFLKFRMADVEFSVVAPEGETINEVVSRVGVLSNQIRNLPAAPPLFNDRSSTGEFITLHNPVRFELFNNHETIEIFMIRKNLWLHRKSKTGKLKLKEKSETNFVRRTSFTPNHDRDDFNLEVQTHPTAYTVHSLNSISLVPQTSPKVDQAAELKLQPELLHTQQLEGFANNEESNNPQLENRPRPIYTDLSNSDIDNDDDLKMPSLDTKNDHVPSSNQNDGTLEYLKSQSIQNQESEVQKDESKNFKCYLKDSNGYPCTTISLDYANLKAHHRSKHKHYSTYYCPLCDKQGPNNLAYARIAMLAKHLVDLHDIEKKSENMEILKQYSEDVYQGKIVRKFGNSYTA